MQNLCEYLSMLILILADLYARIKQPLLPKIHVTLWLTKIKFLALFRKSQTFTIIYTRNIHTVPLYASFKHSTHSQLKNVIAQRNHDGACTAFHKGSLPTI